MNYKIGDMVQLKANYARQVREGTYGTTPTEPVQVMGYTERFSLKDGHGAIDVGPWEGVTKTWRWAADFEPLKGPW